MATAIYMTLTGPNGAQVKGDVDIQGLENTIEVRALQHEVALPEYRTGRLQARSNIKQSDSSREHGCVSVTKRIDPSTPALYKYVCGGKNTLLQLVKLDYYRHDNDGEEKRFYSLLLEDVKVVSVKSATANVFKDDIAARQPHLEEVAFRYGKITWDFDNGKYSHTDAWDKRS